MKKALRIGYNRYYCDENFNEHIEFVRKNSAVIDEITLFPEFCHFGYWDKAFIDNTAEILTDRIKKYREAGIKSVGINILCTRGHTDDGWEILPKGDLQYEVLLNGETSRGCLCISNEKFLDYVRYKYGKMAATGADFIWPDDDLRHSGCTCESCVQKFNAAYGYNFRRDEFVERVRDDKKLVSDWTEFLTDNVGKLFEVIKDAVKGVNPEAELGYMTFMGIDVTSWAEACGAVKGRPGGGFYDERTPVDVFHKCLSVQSQIQKYPERIKDIQYEYEAFNYQSLDRSMRFSELETTLALMSGCNGALYNNDIFNDRQPLIDMLSASAKKWEVLTGKNNGLKNGGVYCEGRGLAKALCEIGIPITYDFENAVAAFILGEEWDKHNDDEIAKILEKGAMTDGRGLEILCERGFSERCGGKIKKEYKSSAAERFTSHPLCSGYENYYRDIFMNFKYYINNQGSAYEFDIAQTAQVVSEIEMITHDKRGCSLFVNDNGSKFAADGYFFINSIKSYAKKAQIGNVLDYISGGKMPVKTDETVKIMPMVRSDNDGNMIVMLVNASFDKTRSFECEIRSDKKIYAMGQEGELCQVKQEKKGNSTVVTIENIDGWDYILLTNIGWEE